MNFGGDGTIKKQKNISFLKKFKGDIYGGITSAVVALPLAIAFGIASGLGASAGIYGAIITGIIAALFGGTPVQITGPTGPITVLVATIVASRGIEFAFSVILLAGLFQILFGIAKFGKIIEYIPSPVISGFMTGIAILIITSQFKIISFSAATVAVTILTVLAIFLIQKWNRKLNLNVPSFLAILILGSAMVALLNLNVPNIGAIPRGLPDLNFPKFDFIILREAIVPALFVALLASVDSLLTSVVCDGMTGKRHNSNKELVGQGMGNFFASLFGGLAGAGATVRSLANIKSGAKTRLSGVIHGMVLLVIIIFFGRYASLIPLSVLAGILVYISITMIDYENLKNLLKQPRADFAVMLITLLVTVLVNLIAGVGVGLVLASLLFVKQMTELEIVKSSVREHLTLEETKKFDIKKLEDKIAVYQINGPLFFGAANNFRKEFSKLPRQRIVVLKMFAVTSIDSTGAQALSDFNNRLRRKNKILLITGIRTRTKAFFEEFGLQEEIGNKNFFVIPRQAIEESMKLIEK